MTVMGMKEVEFVGLSRRKEKDLIAIVKEIYEIR